MRRIETSTLSNQNLATALLCHTHTADADRLIFVRLRAVQIAGNGDYVAYITIDPLGAGTAYRVVPITTAAVASGVTAVMLTTIGIPVKSTDVVKVYLTGLAGDTTTPDIVTEIWEDDGLRPTTADRTLVVDASGRVDVSLIEGADATDALDARIAAAGIPAAVWAVGSRTLTGFGTLVADIITAWLANATIATMVSRIDAAISSRLASASYTAPDNATIATGAASAASAASSAAAAAAGTTTILSKLLKYVQLMVRKDAAIATDNATELTAINASGGSGVGAFASTTDSQEAIRDAVTAGTASAEDIAAELIGVGAFVSSPSQSPAVGSLGAFVRGTTWIMPAISVGALPVDREKLWWTVKTDAGLDDSAAILMVEETDGLLVLNGAPVVAPGNAAAQIVYDDGDDTVTPRVETDATEVIVPLGTLYFDVKYRAAGGTAAHQVAAGTLSVIWGITNTA